jgi:hypothetical protein
MEREGVAPYEARVIEDPHEFVVLENELLRLRVYPALGGKIGSLCVLPGGQELLQQPLLPYALLTRDMMFEEGDASGIDECLPSVSDCVVHTSEGTIAVPDHGDFWRLPFSFHQDGPEVVLEANGFTMPLLFKRRLRLEGHRILLSYRLKNIGQYTVEYVWSAHPSFAVDAGDRVILPDSVIEVTVEDSHRWRLGGRGTKHSWPYTAVADRQCVDLSRAGDPWDDVADKLFSAAPTEGWVALQRMRIDRLIELRFDSRRIPYLGIWQSYGGWPAGRALRQQCVALEPCTAPTDSLADAIKRGCARKLAPQDVDQWEIAIEINSTKRAK